MNDKYVNYFETTSRIEENCEVLAGLKRRLLGSNNLAWLALSEIQNVFEVLGYGNSELSGDERGGVIEQLKVKLKGVTEEHKFLVGESIRELKAVSDLIADDLNLVEKMSVEMDAEKSKTLEFRKEFEHVGKMVVNEFRKPATELSEAEELQELMGRFDSDLQKIA